MGLHSRHEKNLQAIMRVNVYVIDRYLFPPIIFTAKSTIDIRQTSKPNQFGEQRASQIFLTKTTFSEPPNSCQKAPKRTRYSEMF